MMRKRFSTNAKLLRNRLFFISIFALFILLSLTGAQSSSAISIQQSSDASAIQFYCKSDELRFNSTEIGKESYGCLQDGAARLRQMPDCLLIVEGHRDPSEDAGISLKRANNTRDYLVRELGVDASRIIVRDFCYSCPSADKQSNRRVSIGIVSRNWVLTESFVVIKCGGFRPNPKLCSEKSGK